MTRSGSRELVSRGTRRAFRALATNVPQAVVAGLWQDEHFAAADSFQYEDTSIRRRTFESYAVRVDWSEPREVDRALRVFESLLRWLHRQPWHEESSLDEVRERLEQDGLRLEGHGTIRWLRSPSLEYSLNSLSDASGIRAEIERVRRSLPDDPAGAIGAAKQLVEATAKVVLLERGMSIDEKADVPELVKAAQQSLRLHPSASSSGPDGADAVKKILGGVSAIAIGVAELRNRGYGAGHGQAQAPAGLGIRHAHLAVNAAITWCQLLLDTLADPFAPWRRAQTESETKSSTRIE